MAKNDHWQEITAPRCMVGVFDVEQPYECTPLAIFHNEEEALAYIEWCKADHAARPDDSLHINVEYYQALPMRDVKGELWNSYDPIPDEVSP